MKKLLLVLLLFLGAFDALAQQLIIPSRPSSKEAYLYAREQLIASDSLMAFDAHLTLNQAEKEADEKLRALQRRMLKHYKDQHYFPPARYFYGWKEHMLATPLHRILQKMPKGGIMHVHSAAMSDFHWMVDKAVEMENCYVFWGDDTEEHIKGKLQFFKKKEVPKGFQSTKKLYRKNPSFKDELYKLLTFDMSIDKDSADIWGEFEKRFVRITRFVNYQPIFKSFYRDAIQLMIDDGVQHLELREIPYLGLYDLEHPKGYYNADTVIRYWQELETEFQQQYPNFTLQLVLCSIRAFDQQTVTNMLATSYALRAKYPEMITAFDLVAEEDAGHPTLFHLDTWMKMDSLEKAYGIDMPLCLHDGESDWVSVDNLYDAMLLRSKRIGHGFNLFRFPVLQQLARDMEVAIEVNPLSNQILGYLRDLRIHPATYFMTRGIQITISPDDPAIFDYRGVTPDYWAAFLAWELDLQALKKITRNSLEYSNLPDQEKQAALAAWEKDWLAWVEWVNAAL